MSKKLIITCPDCGKMTEVKTGGLFTNTMRCTCGKTFDIRKERYTGCKCPHCGNTVIYDKTRDHKAQYCPICDEPLRGDKHEELTWFSCVQCGIRLQGVPSAEVYTCPVCGHVNDVHERMISEQIKHDGLASIITFEGNNDAIVWKHPIENFNLGSQLIVHESQEAIFFRDGQALDLFGAGRYTLETQQLPLIEKFYKLPTDTEGTFHSEVYYINMATMLGIKWGTDTKVRLFDPASGLHIELGASGEFNIRVVNSRKLLLKVVGTTDGMHREDILGGNGKGFFRALIMTQVKSYLAQTIKECGINILEIDGHMMELSTALRDKINEGLADYGLTMPEFFVSRVVTPDDDPSFRRMKEQYAEQYLLVRQEQIRKSEAEAAQARKTVEAQTAAQLKIIAAQGEAEALRLQKQAEAEAYRMQAEAEAMEMKMKGYTYQQETARQVGLEAMQNGLTGNGTGEGGGMGLGNMIGDLASLGVTLGAVGGVMDMTKSAMAPVMDSMREVTGGSAPATPDIWNCACGQQGITGKFCPECGTPRPAPAGEWTCPACGTKNTGKFCAECGAKKPEASTWDCPNCGTKNMGKFCAECGTKRGE